MESETEYILPNGNKLVIVCKINCSERPWSCSLWNSMNVSVDKNSTPPTLGTEEKA